MSNYQAFIREIPTSFKSVIKFIRGFLWHHEWSESRIKRIIGLHRILHPMKMSNYQAFIREIPTSFKSVIQTILDVTKILRSLTGQCLF